MALNAILKLLSHNPKYLFQSHFPLKISIRSLDLTLNREKHLPDPFPPKHKSPFPYEPIQTTDCVGLACWNVKQPPKTVNRVARLIRHLTVDLALIQLQFCEIRSARDVYATVVSTFKKALKHFGELKPSDLWVYKSHVGRGAIVRSARFRAKGRTDLQRDRFTHYFLILKLGKPPDRTLKPRPTKSEYWLDKPPERIPFSLYPSTVRYPTLEERLGPKLSKNIDRDMPHAL